VTDYAVDQPAASEDLPAANPAEWPQRRQRRAPGARKRPGRARRAPLSPARAAVVMVLGGVAALALWFFLYALVFSGFQESHTQHVLYSQLRYGLAQAIVPFGGVIEPGTPVAYINAPTIGLSAVVVEGTSSADLAKGPGHLPDSPFPGQEGNSEIYGRSATFGAPFGRVHDLRPGAFISVTTGQGTFGFRVLDVRGPGYPVPSAARLGQSSLTLVTSGGTGAWRNGWAPDEVIYADAALISGKVQPAPSGRPTAVSAVDKPLAGDSNELFLVYVWLQALVVLSLGLGWAYTRWNAWQVWLVGVPAVLAVLWATTSAAMLLLPNLA
jgi:sortase A